MVDYGNSNNYEDGDVIQVYTNMGRQSYIIFRQGDGWIARIITEFENTGNYENDVQELMSGEDVKIVGNINNYLGHWF